MKSIAILGLIAFLFSSIVSCESSKANNSPDSWQNRHMKEEHGVDSFDAYSFFTYHDTDGSKTWTKDDILNLYGLLNDHVGDGSGMGTHDEAHEHITEETKQHVLKTILDLIDINGDGVISLEEWRMFNEKGGELPDFGLGPGHHGDYEYEYEVHHWLEYHAENDPDVHNVHPEDIEHEKLFHAHEHGDESDSDHHDGYERLENIPIKFRQQGH